VGLFVGELQDGGYEPSLLFRLLRPKISGNVINGLGEAQRRRPTPVYHRLDHRHPWSWVQLTFYLPQALFRRAQAAVISRSIALDKAGFEPITATRREDSPESWSARVKEAALGDPAVGAVGIARVDPLWVFDRDEVTEPWIIVLGCAMEFDELKRNLDGEYDAANTEVLRTYLRSQEAAFQLANWIRRQGWPARGVGGPKCGELPIIPAAIAAGLGQLGKHGSMMNDRLGSCFRMSYVLTELPLVADAPRDIGVDEFCASCRLCTRHCPPKAIYDEKQMVRGELKWYVDFDKCVPFFNDYDACGICLSVCPWTQPGRAPNIVRKMLLRKSRGGPAGAGPDDADASQVTSHGG
jgi:Pyruvate/2-oxoacid:ferredoxin oxidoreductase delta subunit